MRKLQTIVIVCMARVVGGNGTSWLLVRKSELPGPSAVLMCRAYGKSRDTSNVRNERLSQYIKPNRTGNKMTIEIDGCIAQLEREGIVVPEPVKKNLTALAEVRDNAVHFTNASPQLPKQCWRSERRVFAISLNSEGSGSLWICLVRASI